MNFFPLFNAKDIDGPPQDGGWSDWGSWSCSASCNGGVGIRKRLCNNPEPNIKGEPCLGPSSMTGRCNTIVCGDITEDTIKIIKQKIMKVNTALTLEEGQATIITSDNDTISRVIHDSPDSEIKWAHNGIFMMPANNRIIIERYNIGKLKMFINFFQCYFFLLRFLHFFFFSH